ncbi:MAG: Dabb family protein [Saprospiraceae bacterium]
MPGLPSGKAEELKNVFIHQVYFWLKNPGSDAGREKLIEGLKKYLTGIEVLQTYHIGVPAGTPRTVVDGSYDVSWLAVFKDKAAQDAYQVHPDHKKFVDEYGQLFEKVIVYDSVDA